MTETLDRRRRAAAAPPASRSVFRLQHALASLSAVDQQLLFNRSTSADDNVRQIVDQIVSRVRDDGDRALTALTRELDGVDSPVLEVPPEVWQAAPSGLRSDLRTALVRAAANIQRAHEAGRPIASTIETEPGVTIERRPDPLARVGVYAPGGRAAYPSSVLMGVVPARVAGVRDVVLCSPPSRTGRPSSVVLAAAAIAGVDRVFAVGGAGAIAAMAFGTESVPRVDRIVGPGNAYIAEAKVQLAGYVATDAPAGPSELLIVADESADIGFIARETIAQAEHDPRAAVVIVLVGTRAARRARLVSAAVASLSETAERRATILASLGGRGALLTTASLDEAITFANAWAPEHLLLAVADAESIVPRARGSGTICVGASSSVVFGDYMTGANHVLPTGGLARSYGGLSTLDFVRWTTIQRVTPAAATRLSPAVATLADAERLPAHAEAARAYVNRPEASRGLQ